LHVVTTEQADLATVDAALGVDVVEIELGPGRDRLAGHRLRAGHRSNLDDNQILGHRGNRHAKQAAKRQQRKQEAIHQHAFPKILQTADSSGSEKARQLWLSVISGRTGQNRCMEKTSREWHAV